MSFSLRRKYRSCQNLIVLFAPQRNCSFEIKMSSLRRFAPQAQRNKLHFRNVIFVEARLQKSKLDRIRASAKLQFRNKNVIFVEARLQKSKLDRIRASAKLHFRSKNIVFVSAKLHFRNKNVIFVEARLKGVKIGLCSGLSEIALSK